MSDLKKCPCCGFNEVQIKASGGENSGSFLRYYVECPNCGVGTVIHFMERKVCIARWNNRSDAGVALPSASPNTDSQKCLCTIEDVTHVIGSGHYEGRIIINRACQYHGNCR